MPHKPRNPVSHRRSRNPDWVSRGRTLMCNRRVFHLREKSTVVPCGPKRRPRNRGISMRLRSQVHHRPGSSESNLLSRLWNSGPLIASLRPFHKLFFSYKLAQDSGYTSRMGGIAGRNQSIHHVGGRRITIFRFDKINDGIGQSLGFGKGLPQESSKNCDGLTKLCTLALQFGDHFIERFEFF